MVKIIAVVLGLFMFCATAQAADSVVSADYLSALQKKAEAGDVVSQFNLGVLYHNGQGVTQDYKKAAEWLHKAADQGDSDAALNLYVLYANGQGVAQDPKQAAEWCQRAADQGNTNAALILSTLYKKGLGVPHDEKMAASWFIRGAQGSGQLQPLGSPHKESGISTIKLALIALSLAAVLAILGWMVLV
jgi:TPR repeat protein